MDVFGARRDVPGANDTYLISNVEKDLAMQLPPRRPTVFRPRGAAQMCALRQFWYRVRVAELGQDMDIADHDALELSDPLSMNGEVLALRTERDVIGTAILMPCVEGAAADHAALYNMASLGDLYPERSGIIGGIALAGDFRSAKGLYPLIAETYRFALAINLAILATDTDDLMLGPMLDLGFLPWGSSFDDPARGRRYVLKLDCRDAQHLAAMHSPLEEILQQAGSRVSI